MICLFFAFPFYSNAAEIGSKSSCDVNGKNKCGNGKGSSNYTLGVNCGGTSGFDIKTCPDKEVIDGKTECKVKPGSNESYNVVLLVDVSSSMNGGSKLSMANSAISKIITLFKEKSPTSQIKARSFCSTVKSIQLKNGTNDFVPVSQVDAKNNYGVSTCPGTYTRLFVKNAY